jgi:hypothetical protein
MGSRLSLLQFGSHAWRGHSQHEHTCHQQEHQHRATAPQQWIGLVLGTLFHHLFLRTIVKTVCMKL